MLISIALISDPHGGSSIDEKKKKEIARRSNIFALTLHFICVCGSKLLCEEIKVFTPLSKTSSFAFILFKRETLQLCQKKLKWLPAKQKMKRKKNTKVTHSHLNWDELQYLGTWAVIVGRDNAFLLK